MCPKQKSLRERFAERNRLDLHHLADTFWLTPPTFSTSIPSKDIRVLERWGQQKRAEHPISSVVVESTAESARGIGIDPSDFCCTVVVNKANPRDLSESKVKLKKTSTDLMIFLPQFGVRSKVWDHTWVCCEASCGPQIRQKTCGIAKRCFRLRRLRLWPSEAKTQVNAVFRQRWDMSDTSFKTSVLSLWVGKYRSRRINMDKQ